MREPPKGGDVSKVLREWAEAGLVDRLIELFEALGRQVPGEDMHRIRIARAAGSVEEALAQTPSLACVRALLHVVKQPRPRILERGIPEEERLRKLASLLSSAQPQETLLRVLNAAGTNAAERELLACWMQECILRGGVLEEEERARHFHAALRIRGHPLAALPLTLDELEPELTAYLRGPRRKSESGHGAASSPRTPLAPGEEPSGESVPHEVEDKALTERMTAAVEGWLEAGNCNLEARVFRLEPPVASGDQAVGLLPKLGVEALTDADAEPPTPRRLGPEEVLRMLFVAAAKGGAFGAARQGAYGRLSAWRSLSALVGAGEAEPIAAVAAVARRCTFWDFSLSTSWFYAVAWDLGLVVLRPDGASLAVLAATDTG